MLPSLERRLLLFPLCLRTNHLFRLLQRPLQQHWLTTSRPPLLHNLCTYFQAMPLVNNNNTNQSYNSRILTRVLTEDFSNLRRLDEDRSKPSTKDSIRRRELTLPGAS